MHLRWPWLTPVLRNDEESRRERKTTWLELFYDLVFVIVVAQFTHHFAEHPTLESALVNALFFLPILWSWLGFVFYNDRFETEDLSERFFTIVNMVIVVAIALASQGGEANEGTVVVCYVLLRGFIVFLWLRAGWHNPVARHLTNRYALGFSLSIVLWLLSLGVDGDWRIGLRAIGFAIDLVTPATTLKEQAKLPALTSSHFSERFGLLLIIVLGDVVADLIIGRAPGAGFALPAAASGIAVAVAIWWVYFDDVMGNALKGGMRWRAPWVYLHLPLVLGLMGFGSAQHHLILEGDGNLDGASRALLSLSLGISLIALGLLQATLAGDQRHRMRMLAACLIGAVLALGVGGTMTGDPRMFFAALAAAALPPVITSLLGPRPLEHSA